METSLVTGYNEMEKVCGNGAEISTTMSLFLKDLFMLLYPHHNRFTALFPGPSGWAGARRELLDLMAQGKINRGRHTDHPDGRHSIRISNQCPPPSSPYFLQAGWPSCRPTYSVKAPVMLLYIYWNPGIRKLLTLWTAHAPMHCK